MFNEKKVTCGLNIVNSKFEPQKSILMSTEIPP